MNRTIVVQLHPTPEQARSLKTTLEQYTVCLNTVAQEGFTTGCSNGVELHKRTYYPLRAQYPDLPAQLVCSARVKATEAVKSALTWKIKKEKAYLQRVEQAKKQGKPPPVFKPVRCPRSDMTSVRYDQRSYWVHWETLTCSLSTVNGRVVLSFKVPAYYRQYSGHKVCSADVCYRHGRFFLHMVVSLPEPVVAPRQEVIGVDLGLNRPAVTSQRQFLGEKRWKEQDRRIFRLRRALAGRLLNCTRVSSTRPRREGLLSSELTLGILRKPAANVAITIAQTVSLRVSSAAAAVATNSMLI
nr:hypothetical protein [Thermogemmatispora sp.]